MTLSEANQILAPTKHVRPGTSCTALEYVFLDVLHIERVLAAADMEHVQHRRAETAREVVNRALIARAVAAGRMPPAGREPDRQMLEAEFALFQQEHDPVGEAEATKRLTERRKRLAVEEHAKKSTQLRQTRDALAYHQREAARLKALLPAVESEESKAKDEVAASTTADEAAGVAVNEMQAGAKVVAKREAQEESDRAAAEAADKEAAVRQAEADNLAGYRAMAEIAQRKRAEQDVEAERLRVLGRAALAGKVVRA